MLATVIILTISARSCLGRNSNKTQSGSSNYNTFVINAPSELTATAVSSFRIDLFWQDNSNNEDGFEIERSTDGINYSLLTTIYSNGASYSDTIGLFPTTPYYYRVRAMNTIGDRSAWSNISSAIFIPTWSAVAAGGFYSVALDSEGAIYTWGLNEGGQLGLGDNDNRYIPNFVRIDSNGDVFNNISAISAGLAHTVILTRAGTVWTCGNNDYGQLGLGDTISANVPFPIIGNDSDWRVTASGELHTIAVKTNLSLWGWGCNNKYQLGLGYSNPSTIGITAPIQIGTESDWSITAAGYYHSMGIKINGTLWAWGLNVCGQLGDGTLDIKEKPEQIGTDSDWSALTGGELYSLGLKTDRTLWAWGINNNGQLGIGFTNINGIDVPTQIGSDSNWSMVSAGAYHTIAIKTNGSIWSWGCNRRMPNLEPSGQLGLGDTIDRYIPTLIVFIPQSPDSLTAVPFSLSQIDLSWVDRSYNETGFKIERSPVTNTSYAIIATIGSNITTYSDSGLAFNTAYYYRISSFNNFGDSLYSNEAAATTTLIAPANLIITSSGEITLSWTDNSPEEDGFKIERKGSNGIYEQIAIVGANITSWIDTGPFLSGNRYYYRVRSYNMYGNSSYLNEVSIIMPGNWLTVDSGYYHTVAIRTNGTIWSWGKNDTGQLGLGDTNMRMIPTKVGAFSDWFSCASGNYHNISLKSNPAGGGTIWVWGNNDYGQLGLDEGGGRNTPTQDGSASDWLPQDVSATNLSFVSAGANHTIAIKTNGTLWAWGWNHYGQLGDETNTNRTTPRQVGTNSDWIQVDSYSYHTLGVKTNRTIWAWGWNYYGQLGLGYTILNGGVPTPTQIGSDLDWSVLTAGAVHSSGLKIDGTIWAWGKNDCGQLGLGYTTISTTGITAPTQVGMDTDWLAVNSGNEYTLALKTNPAGGGPPAGEAGTLWAWGANGFDQLGLGDNVNRITPTQVGTYSDWIKVVAGRNYTLGLRMDRTLWAWGNNWSGQLGLGDTIQRLIPTLVEEIIVPPVLTATVISFSQIKLSWTDDSDETGFKIERSPITNTNYVPVATVGSNIISYLDTGLTLGRTYYYRVQTFYGFDNSSYSNEVSATPTLFAPTLLNITVVSSTQINLSWTDNSSDETGFIIERSYNGTSYEQLTTTNTDVTVYPDLTVTRGNIYYYRVKASYLPDGEAGPVSDSAYSNVAVGVAILCFNKIGSPSARQYHSMVWDPVGQRVIMFGGYGASPTYKNDLWWYDPASNTWTEQTPASSPSVREGHSMVWDSIEQKVIMFGGSDGAYKNDLWWYDPASNTWTEQTPASSPSVREGHSMVWDPVGQRVIMFGGSDVFRKNDLWWYDPASNTWTEQTPAISPTARNGHSMVWDPVGQKVIMFGGSGTSPTYKNDLWWYDPTSGTNGAWIDMTTTAISPTARIYHSMVWDPVGQCVIMFGGFDSSLKNDLWWYDPTSGTNGEWIDKTTMMAISPPARQYHSMVWDPVGQKVIMFGGADASRKNDLWWYDPASGTNGAWIDKTTTAISPTARIYHSMVWDPVGQKVIMFGGSGTSPNYKNDLWWYDPASGTNGAWIDKTTTAISPTARNGYSMVWDSIEQKVIMFGGSDGAGAYKNDLWWYDPISNTWIKQTSVSSPTARQGHKMVWDGQKVIMFGGYNGVYKNDLWWWW
jgi:alpha-tubulin suppressor-like RCC1 family protein